MRINGDGVWLYPADKELLGIRHSNYYTLYEIGSYLVRQTQSRLTEAVGAEIARFDKSRCEWDNIDKAFEAGDYESKPIERLATILMTLEGIAREQH
jgi:transposase